MLSKYLQKISELRGVIIFLSTLFLVLGLWGGCAWEGRHKILVERGDTVVVRDTLIQKEVEYRNLPAEVDTVKIVKTQVDTLLNTIVYRDTVIVTEVAKLDTMLAEGRLKLSYYVAPRYFDFYWQPVPREIICRQLVEDAFALKEPGRLRFYIGGGGGQTWDKKKLNYQGFLSGQFDRNMLYLTAGRSGYTLGYGRQF